MYIKIEDDEEGEIEGFVYVNRDGYEEKIVLNEPSCTYFKFQASRGEIKLYFDDIPMIVKALQATHTHYKGAK